MTLHFDNYMMSLSIISQDQFEPQDQIILLMKEQGMCEDLIESFLFFYFIL